MLSTADKKLSSSLCYVLGLTMTDESKSLKIARNLAVGEGATGLHRLLGEYQPDIVNRYLGLLMSTMNWSIRPTDPVAAINESDLRINAHESQSSEKMAERFGTVPEVQKYVMKDSARSAVILAQDPFPVRTCTMFFPFTSASGFALSKCLQLSFVVSHLFSWHVRVMERMCLFLPYLSPLRIWVLLTALFLTSRILNKWLAAWQPLLPPWKQMRLLSPVDPAQQDLGIYSDIVMAPQPLDLLGLMTQGHLMTIETQDEGLIRSQALKMNKREVPSYFDSLVSKTTKKLRCGSMIFRKNPICPHTTNLSEFIAKQVLCRPDLYLKHEPNVKTMLLDMKMISTPCIDDHHFKEELKSVGELSKVCSQIVLKCFSWHVLEVLIFYGQ